MTSNPSNNPQVSDSVVIYSTVWCGYCQRLKAQLTRAGVHFTEVDIEADPAAARFVASINGGNMTVPTVTLPDGSVFTNPPVGTVLSQLGQP